MVTGKINLLMNARPVKTRESNIRKFSFIQYLLADLPHNDPGQKGEKEKGGQNDDAQAEMIDSLMAEIPSLPVRRQDETLKAFEQAPSCGDLAAHAPGSTECPRRVHFYGHGCQGSHFPTPLNILSVKEREIFKWKMLPGFPCGQGNSCLPMAGSLTAPIGEIFVNFCYSSRLKINGWGILLWHAPCLIKIAVFYPKHKRSENDMLMA